MCLVHEGAVHGDEGGRVRTHTVTVREGEDLGPVDWTHPMVAKVEATRPALVGALREAEKADLRASADSAGWEATTDGGWPRCGWGNVLAVRMWDGWPYWQPTPSVLVSNWTGGATWHAIDAISDVRRVPS